MKEDYKRKIQALVEGVEDEKILRRIYLMLVAMLKG